jgi:hypothetical protein
LGVICDADDSLVSIEAHPFVILVKAYDTHL